MNTLPLLLIALIPLAVLAHWLKIYPHRPLVWVLLVPAALSIALAVWEDALPLVLAIDAAVAAAAIGDLVTLPRHGTFLAERNCGHIASLGKPHRVTLTVSNRSRMSRVVWIRDGADEDLRPDPEDFTLVLPGMSRSTVHYDLRPRRRGRFELSELFLRARSRLGFWQRHLSYACESVIAVYPDMKQLGEYAVLARTDRLSLLGVRRTRKIGQDNEFERLRDYTLDDNYKHIDWRSTARRNKLTVRDFQANQSQRIIFLIDFGRMMTGHARGINLLDHALNAMLMLSYVALRQNDKVGLLCFSDGVHDYVPPAGGMTQTNRLLHAAYDRFPRMVESRYDEAFLHLASHCRKRALIVLITNVIDEVNAMQIQQYLTNLVGRHLPLGVLLRDHALFDAVELPAEVALENVADERLYPAAAAADILTWRHQVLADLEAAGVLALDVFPESMTAPLVNRYLEVKARHLL